jgi:hypothetical protein
MVSRPEHGLAIDMQRVSCLTTSYANFPSDAVRVLLSLPCERDWLPLKLDLESTEEIRNMVIAFYELLPGESRPEKHALNVHAHLEAPLPSIGDFVVSRVSAKRQWLAGFVCAHECSAMGRFPVLNRLWQSPS